MMRSRPAGPVGQRSRPTQKDTRSARFVNLSPTTTAGLGSLFDSTWQSESPSALSELRAACDAFVRRLRDDGFTPEQVLVVMKREITGKGALHQAPSLRVSQADQDARRRTHTYEQLFRWFLQAYFDT